MNSDRRMALLFFILMIILAITLERMLYTSGEVTLKGKAEITLLEAIEDGLNAQYKALGLYEAGFVLSWNQLRFKSYLNGKILFFIERFSKILPMQH